MLKRYTLTLGLGLALSLAACAQSGTNAPTQDQQSKTDTSQSEKRGERRGPRGDREGRTPPAAAYAACASVALESACTIETPRGSRTGVCRIREGDDRAVCAIKRPEGRRPRPAGQ